MQATLQDIPDGQLATLRALGSALLDDCAAAAGVHAAGELPKLRQAFEQLGDVMQRLEADAGSGHPAAADVTEIGQYALHLAGNLAAECARLQLSDAQLRLAALPVGMALWVARHDGVIDTLEPVVDAIARLANSSRDPRWLARFCDVIGRIVAAVAPAIREDLEKFNPGRPWRILLLNQSIVATRSHDTGLMELAFGILVRHLPDDAARFFAEGMQQMDALDYPEQVRRLMQKYHRQWTLNRSLH